MSRKNEAHNGSVDAAGVNQIKGQVVGGRQAESARVQRLVGARFCFHTTSNAFPMCQRPTCDWQRKRGPLGNKFQIT